ncbi:MAG: hypothetical protein OEW00_08425 [candidate division Zixibacteria bacterium]|nr:hypothetical protein [candidate division Zixibacteria bacterium]
MVWVRRSYLARFSVYFAVVSMIAGSLYGADKQVQQGGVGLKAGFLHKATFTVNKTEYDSKMGLNVGVFFDVPAYSLTMVSVAADFRDIQILDHRQWMLDLSIGLKPTIYKEKSRLAVKPGVAVGFGYLPDIAWLSSTTYLTLKASTEVLFLVTRKYAYVAEFMVFSAPVGGNRQLEISTSPTISLRLGVMY